MKIFHCDCCGALVFFENVTCVQCGHTLGFLPDVMDMAALEPTHDQTWKSLAPHSKGRIYRACANGRDFSVCNWFVPAEETSEFCVACRMNALVPDASILEKRLLWHKIEIAKRRLIYGLHQLALPTGGCPTRMWPHLQFRFLADEPGMLPVVTGHESGVITLNIAEADDVERERRRTQLREPQRTLIGHFRHESGHYYWEALIADSPRLERFRLLFGDERLNYAEALESHYADGPPSDRASRFVSAYASVHPWEDWAETWAHYLHMVDFLETAEGFGLSLHPQERVGKATTPVAGTAPMRGSSFDTMLECWLPLTCALNSLNRGAGIPDLYPFVLSAPAREKLRFVHELILWQQRGLGRTPDTPPTMLQKAG